MDSCQLLTLSCLGKTRQALRLLPISALESGDVKNAVLKVADTEGMYVMHTFFLCVCNGCDAGS